MTTVVYSRRKPPGHYDNYERVFSAIAPCRVERRLVAQVLGVFGRDRIVFLDADGMHLLFSPFVALRSLFGLKSIFLSLRTEHLLRLTARTAVWRAVFRLVKWSRSSKVVSIHKDGEVDGLARYVDEFIYDLQYWDLDLLDLGSATVPEWSKSGSTSLLPKVLVFGSLNQKRLRGEWLEFLARPRRRGFELILAGDSGFSETELALMSDCVVIDRAVSDAEMMFLFGEADYLVVYRDLGTCCPSGIFGRAIQMGKTVIVKSGGYLARNHKEYAGLLAIERLEDLERVVAGTPEPVESPDYDDRELLASLMRF
ncbi:MAG: hypothetical protein WD942_10055 [Dehalococcoidia bacterium]